MDTQVIDDLFQEYALVSTEVEQGRLAFDAPQVLALAARMSEAMVATSPNLQRPTVLEPA